MIVNVGPDGDFRTINEAICAVPYEESATIRIAAGIYREKLFIEKKDIRIEGVGMDDTVIEYADGAEEKMPDGARRGTFRSQTMFLGGKRCVLKDLSVINSAGPGEIAGQAVALYADAESVYLENVELSSYQDTLFTAPLPVAEKQPNGFLGPRVLTERKLTKQYYKNCRIIGNVDFIFGGADAVFDGCDIIVRNRSKEINGYITAPGDNPGRLGYAFLNCRITGEDPDMKESVFLGRPWRSEGKAAFLSCRYDGCIHPLRFSEWGMTYAEESNAHFAEYAPADIQGNPISTDGRNPWVRLLDDNEAKVIYDICSDIHKTVYPPDMR